MQKISFIILMGDSLSDCGTMAKRKLFNIIPMADASGLGNKSPKGRFTNGYVWIDRFNLAISEEAIIQELKQEKKSPADNIISKRSYIKKFLRKHFNLDSDTHFNYKGHDFFRNYSEGGMTSHDYSNRATLNLKMIIIQKILSHLDEKRRLFLEDDKARLINLEQKKESLIIEWSGVNDLITVNRKPTYDAVDKAIQARLRNVEELFKNGYQNFALFNLPDLSLTPRFQARSLQEQNEAHELSMHFNRKLNEGRQHLQSLNPACHLDVYDVNKLITDVFNHPERFHLDPKKLNQPFKTSADFKNNIYHAKGYMFWDDVHPTSNVHAFVANQFYDEFANKYNITPLSELLIQAFRWHNSKKCKK